jgi:hypothetical protein
LLVRASGTDPHPAARFIGSTSLDSEQLPVLTASGLATSAKKTLFLKNDPRIA